MKVTLSLLCLFFSVTTAMAAAKLDRLMGEHQGTGSGGACKLSFVKKGHELNLWFMATSSASRALFDVRRELERQLSRDSGSIVLSHDRDSMYDATIRLTILLNRETGLPLSMSGTVEGLMHETVDCNFQ